MAENHAIEDTSTKVETKEKHVDLTSVKKKRKKKKKKNIRLGQGVEPEANKVDKEEEQMDLAHGERENNDLDQDVETGVNTVEKQEQVNLTTTKKKKKKRKRKKKKNIGLNLDVEVQANPVEKKVESLNSTIGETKENLNLDVEAKINSVEEKEEQLDLTNVRKNKEIDLNLDVDPVTPEANSVEEKEEQLDMTNVRKKKEIDLNLDVDLVTPEANTVEEKEEVLDLSNVKKNKKKKKKVNFDEFVGIERNADENNTKSIHGIQANGDNNEEEEELDLSSMKKKKKKKKSSLFKLTEGSELFQEKQFHELEPEFVYPDDTYKELLDKVFSSLKQFHPDLVSGDKRSLNYKPPQCARVGSKKTSFINFIETCRGLKRKPKHMIAFFLSELGTSGSIDGNNQFIIKGRFQQKQLESVLRRYIKEYVMCHTCKSESTQLEREARLYFLRCNMCKSSRSVAAIKSGFQAVTGKRAKLRAKADS